MHKICEALAEIINFVGFAIIIIGAARGLFHFISFEANTLFRKSGTPKLETVRLKMGSYILLGLEFSVAADIIFTMLEPGTERLLQLGGLILIRTVITYFVDREHEQIQKNLSA